MIKDCCSCIHEYRSPMLDICRECGIAMLNYEERKPKTNADKIRSMSDEGLAEWMATIEKKCYARCGVKSNFERFKKQWLDWLKAPVEVDNGT